MPPEKPRPYNFENHLARQPQGGEQVETEFLRYLNGLDISGLVSELAEITGLSREQAIRAALVRELYLIEAVQRGATPAIIERGARPLLFNLGYELQDRTGEG